MEFVSRPNVLAVNEVFRNGPEMISCFTENIDDFLLEVGDPVSRWMFSDSDLLQKALLLHLRSGI